MSSVSAPSPAAPVAAESQAGPVLQLAEAGGRGRPWLRFPGSTASRLWLCDAVALMLAYALGTIVSTDAAANPVWPLCFGSIVVALLAGRGHYQPRLEPRHLDAIRGVLTLTAVAAAFTISVRVFVGDADDAASEVTRLWILAATLLVASRLWIALTGRAASARERCCPTLIVGAGKVGQSIARRLTAHPEYGLRPVGFLDKEPLVSEGSLELPVLGASWDLDNVVAEHGIRHVIVTFSTAPTDVLVRIMNTCEKIGVRASLRPEVLREDARAVHRRPSRRAASGLAAAGKSAWAPDRTQVLARPRRGRHRDRVVLTPAGRARARRAGVFWDAPSCTGRSVSVVTGSASTCSSSARCGLLRTRR